jgi:hypothetical protein
LLEVPGTLAAAAFSLQFNLCAVRSSTLAATCRLLLKDSSEVRPRDSRGGADLRTMTFGVKEVVRQVAVSLDISPSSYANFIKLIHLRSLDFDGMLEPVRGIAIDEYLLSSTSHVDMIAAVLTLSALSEQLRSYFCRDSSRGASNIFSALVREVLSDLQLVCLEWKTMGYSEHMVERVCIDLFCGGASVHRSNFQQKISSSQSTLNFSSSDSIISQCNELDGADDAFADELDGFDFSEMDRYACGRGELFRLRDELFTVFPSGDESGNKSVAIAQVTTGGVKRVIVKELLRKSTVLPDLIDMFSYLNADDMVDFEIHIKIRYDPDERGAAKSIMAQAASELQTDPTQVRSFTIKSGALLVTAVDHRYI